MRWGGFVIPAFKDRGRTMACSGLAWATQQEPVEKIKINKSKLYRDSKDTEDICIHWILVVSRIDITKYRKLGGLKSRKLFIHFVVVFQETKSSQSRQ